MRNGSRDRRQRLFWKRGRVQSPILTRSRDGVLDAIGATPLVRLRRAFPDAPFHVYAKLEALNPSGSAKDRSAANILLNAIGSGQAIPGQTVVVESSSGNFAIGLAQACRYLDLDLVCIVDPTVTAQNLAILQAYGAKVEVIPEGDVNNGGYLESRLRRVEELLTHEPSVYWPNQYANLLNAEAYSVTMDEIIQALDGELDYLFCPVGTCGTLRGAAEFVRRRGLPTKIIAVDAIGSAIFDQPARRRLIPGLGSSLRPDLYKPGLAADVVHVADLESIAGCRHLVRTEAWLAGGSSGAVVSALAKYMQRIPSGTNCVLILPDRGERYLDSIYSDAWVRGSFGRLPDSLCTNGREEG
jgi:N-(2-amino-2-carboxyethyl)-L-glutamate synthase